MVSYDETFKILILGEASVGKNPFVRWYCYSYFNPSKCSSPNKKDHEEKINCQYCGMELTDEEQITHTCKEKPKNT